MATRGLLASGGSLRRIRACPPFEGAAGTATARRLQRLVGDRAFAHQTTDELGPRAHVQLSVDAAQVALDRLRAEEERRARLFVRRAVRDDQGDLELLRSQLFGGVRVPRTRCFARRSQLAARPFGPRRRAELLKSVERLPERLPCVRAFPSAAEPLAEAQLRPRKLEGRCRQPVHPQRLLEQLLVARIVGKQAAAAGGGRLRPGAAGRLGEGLERPQGAFGVVAPSRPYVGLDQIGGPLDDRRLPQAARFGLAGEAVENPYGVLVVTLPELQKAESREGVRDHRA